MEHIYDYLNIFLKYLCIIFWFLKDPVSIVITWKTVTISRIPLLIFHERNKVIQVWKDINIDRMDIFK